MTQAPTPGPLSQIPTAVVADTMNVMARAYERIHSMPRVSDTELAIKVGEAKERLRPFLAPTAPVEASGSERPPAYPLHVGKEIELHGHRWVVKGIHLGDLGQESLIHLEGLSHEPGWTGPWETHPMLFIPEIMLSCALRPQPSGETRFGDETAEQIVKRWAAWINDASEDMEEPEWGGKTRNDVLNERDFLIRCLSDRPLALGGQQGETIEQRFPALNDHLIRMASSGNTGSLAEWGEFFECLRVALSTTPARAEALDEGAAGEPYAWALVNAHNDTIQRRDQMHPDFALLTDDDLISEGWTPLYAHPSPTPAADADRVRIADADAKWLARWLGDQKEGGHCGEGNVERRERAIWNDRIDRILAALKSEGK